MNTLSLHIERLLLSHNCVVVPHFGAFVTLASAATRVEHEELFFPPLRIVRFNPNVVEDDGLLVSDVKRQCRCSEAEAKHTIQAMVLNLRQQLLADGEVDFGSIGRFSQDDDGRVAFAACQAGAVTPCYFGLDAFCMPRLKAGSLRAKNRQAHATASATSGTDNRHITIRVNRRLLRYAVVAAAAILVCFTFNSPLPPHDTPTPQVATITLPSSTLPALSVSVEPTGDAASMDAATVADAVATTDIAEVAAAGADDDMAVEDEPTSHGSYCIVLASAVSQRNGDDYVARLLKRGYTNARVYDNGRIRRVVLDGFATEAEANSANAALHRQGREFASTWVLDMQ